MTVALSLQRLASARQVKLPNHTMIVPSQLPGRRGSYQYAEQIAVEEEEEESEDTLLSRFADEIDLQTGILFGFLVSILFAFINAFIIVKGAKFPSRLFRRKLCWIRSVSPFLKMSCFVDIARLKFL